MRTAKVPHISSYAHDRAHYDARCAARRSCHSGLVWCAALVSGVVAGTGLSVPAAGSALPSIELSAIALPPGTIFVVNAGAPAGTGNGSVTAYRPTATGNARPSLLITAGINRPIGLTFDVSGDLWVANADDVVEYSKTELTKASPAPTVTITERATGPAGVAFDPSGDLWVVEGAAVEFTKAQLAKSGSPKPKVVIASGNVCSLAFDPSGDLWEGTNSDSVSDFTKAQLAVSGLPTPHVTVYSSALRSPCRPTFDPAGDMWAANFDADTVVEFTKAQLSKSGPAAPWVTLTYRRLSNPGDVALDLAGDLWVPSPGENLLVEFAKAQLAKSGSPTPARIIVGPATGLKYPWAVAVEP
jgi:hypothetical protein